MSTFRLRAETGSDTSSAVVRSENGLRKALAAQSWWGLASRRLPATSTERRRPPRGERGQAAIEVGLTVVLLFGLIFLVMDLAMLLFVQSTLMQAVREGVRVGVTGRPYAGNVYVNDAIRAMVQDQALGFLNGTSGACRIRIDYFNPDTGAVSTGTQGDLLVVSVSNFNYTPLGAVLKSADPFSISVSSSDIVERCPASGCPTTVNPNGLVCN
jgi:Flp pilus assembly protein TadG